MICTICRIDGVDDIIGMFVIAERTYNVGASLHCKLKTTQPYLYYFTMHSGEYLKVEFI